MPTNRHDPEPVRLPLIVTTLSQRYVFMLFSPLGGLYTWSRRFPTDSLYVFRVSPIQPHAQTIPASYIAQYCGLMFQQLETRTKISSKVRF
jgi:hypothetical protein